MHNLCAFTATLLQFSSVLFCECGLFHYLSLSVLQHQKKKKKLSSSEKSPKQCHGTCNDPRKSYLPCFVLQETSYICFADSRVEHQYSSIIKSHSHVLQWPHPRATLRVMCSITCYTSCKSSGTILVQWTFLHKETLIFSLLS